MRIWRSSRQIGIDCGSGYPEFTDPALRQYWGRLACLRLDDMREFYSEEPYEQDKTDAEKKLLTELERGRKSGEEQGYTTLDKAAAEDSNK